MEKYMKNFIWIKKQYETKMCVFFAVMKIIWEIKNFFLHLFL